MIRISRRQGCFLIIGLIFLVILSSSVMRTTAVVAGRDSNRAANSSLADVPILNYHKVDNFYHALSVSPQEFEEQMAYLAKNGFTTITPDQLMAYLNHDRELPEKPIIITFDDGYLDNYTNAYPVMKKYGFTATIFLVTNLVGHDERFMTWEQVQTMQQDGFVFGSHTVSHIPLNKLPREQAMAELIDSRKEIEYRLGTKTRYFAYPTGAYNSQVEEMVKQAGYKAAFTIRYGQAGAESNPYALERIPIFRGQHTFRSFFVRLNAAPILERFGLIRN
ncbi:polysaccharide deacetylase family protein [Sporomusa acidovorans]|uniref:Poly-beta-1,6-N-acetyl-D-glucosamine N-deacetylase n=1 Tax=Sporomusa acidovorans (strain ATCC 49682 / DSM 3132 / Mol) TaxID=1123286 RepID=A0ABZ3J1P4_SPOA4|nr:polysaccharide deacetylase family protein [Sporomusa acidovorans]OZC13596.1 poly-beta-1,6-N-acetyl-D-glucosamine N-deacetylase precursor [Sporomusa acidovorans DSM 3132]SDE87163.1 Polysaccharide deacetylase [Sporomusa acidovorans]